MLEMKVTLEIPDLAAAIVKLAEALTSKPLPDWNDAVVANPAPANGIPQAVQYPQVAPTPAPVAFPTTPAASPNAHVPGAAVTSPTAVPAMPPVAQTPTYTMDQLGKAGADLILDPAKLQPLQAILAQHGVQTLGQLRPEQYGAVATALRGLGAKI